jgi:hypothetical protein
MAQHADFAGGRALFMRIRARFDAAMAATPPLPPPAPPPAPRLAPPPIPAPAAPPSRDPHAAGSTGSEGDSGGGEYAPFGAPRSRPPAQS